MSFFLTRIQSRVPHGNWQSVILKPVCSLQRKGPSYATLVVVERQLGGFASPTRTGLGWFARVRLGFILFFFLLFRAAPKAYGSSQVKGEIGAAATSLYLPQQCQIQALSSTYTTAHGNTRSLTHWARPGIEPTTSWFLVGFIYAVPQPELLLSVFMNYFTTLSISFESNQGICPFMTGLFHLSWYPQGLSMS